MEGAMRDLEAECPKCGGRSPVEWDGTIPPGGHWWAGGGSDCPRCGAVVLVESECEFFEVDDG